MSRQSQPVRTRDLDLAFAADLRPNRLAGSDGHHGRPARRDVPYSAATRATPGNQTPACTVFLRFSHQRPPLDGGASASVTTRTWREWAATNAQAAPALPS